MGYTHYWRNSEIDEDTWREITHDAVQLICCSSVPVYYESDTVRLPRVDPEAIRFNGVGEDGHETFLLRRNGESAFEFCKTARKPYDILVAAILAAIRDRTLKIVVNSDGDLDDQEWVDALAFASKTLGREIKFPVIE